MAEAMLTSHRLGVLPKGHPVLEIMALYSTSRPSRLGKFDHDRSLFSRTLESWLIREIISKWPQVSG